MRQFPKLLGIFLIVVVISSYPVFAVSSMTQTVTVNVPESVGISTSGNREGSNSTVYMKNLSINGMENSWIGDTCSEQLQSLSNVNINIYIKASGDFTNPYNNETVPLANFYFAGGNNSNVKTQITTNYVNVASKWSQLYSGEKNVLPINLYLTVPLGTKPGSYTTTIYYVAVKDCNLGPV